MLQVANAPFKKHTALQPVPWVVVSRVVVEVHVALVDVWVIDVRVVVERVVVVDVRVVDVRVIVEGQPRDLCSQHQAFHSGVQAISHMSASASQSYNASVRP